MHKFENVCTALVLWMSLSMPCEHTSFEVRDFRASLVDRLNEVLELPLVVIQLFRHR